MPAPSFPAITPVSRALAEHVASGGLSADPLQAEAARALDRVHAGLVTPRRMFQKRDAVEGLYLVGEVGRGKTMLMDLFFAGLPIPEKRRAHFHAFMDEVHAAIAAHRKSKGGQGGDPVAAVVKPMLREFRVLCLDEFQVQDITNAMLLGRLFQQLWEGGVTLVATSNTEPDRLYEGGLNRQLVLPFIAELKQRCAIVTLDGPTDYRRLKFAGEEVYQFGTGPEVTEAMDRLWLHLTGGEPGHAEEVRSLGRTIPVPRAAMGAARFSFAELCDAPLGARDYLRIAEAYDTLMLDGVPRFGPANPSAAKRFILLVDTLYDRGARLAASFASSLDELAEESRMKAEFARCTSRLVEMRSEAYLSRGHRPPADGANQPRDDLSDL